MGQQQNADEAIFRAGVKLFEGLLRLEAGYQQPIFVTMVVCRGAVHILRTEPLMNRVNSKVDKDVSDLMDYVG